jgi:RimJ/RimL family protein N-acetyltransferase
MEHAGFPHGLGITQTDVRAKLNNDTEESQRLVLEVDGHPIGEMNYRRIAPGTAEIGIKICLQSEQGRGYGTQFLRLLIYELLVARHYERIVLDTNRKNTRAQHVYEKLGFRKVGVDIDSWRNQVGELQTVVRYELDRDTWRNDRAGPRDKNAASR